MSESTPSEKPEWLEPSVEYDRRVRARLAAMKERMAVLRAHGVASIPQSFSPGEDPTPEAVAELEEHFRQLKAEALRWRPDPPAQS